MQIATYNEIRAPRWGKEEKDYQIVAPKKAYVYGTGRNNCLVHKINYIKLRWWTYGPGGHYLVRLESPLMSAETFCGRYIRLSDTSGKMCELPNPDAVPSAPCSCRTRDSTSVLPLSFTTLERSRSAISHSEESSMNIAFLIVGFAFMAVGGFCSLCIFIFHGPRWQGMISFVLLVLGIALVFDAIRRMTL